MSFNPELHAKGQLDYSNTSGEVSDSGCPGKFRPLDTGLEKLNQYPDQVDDAIASDNQNGTNEVTKEEQTTTAESEETGQLDDKPQTNGAIDQDGADNQVQVHVEAGVATDLDLEAKPGEAIDGLTEVATDEAPKVGGDLDEIEVEHREMGVDVNVEASEPVAIKPEGDSAAAGVELRKKDELDDPETKKVKRRSFLESLHFPKFDFPPGRKHHNIATQTPSTEKEREKEMKKGKVFKEKKPKKSKEKKDKKSKKRDEPEAQKDKDKPVEKPEKDDEAKAQDESNEAVVVTGEVEVTKDEEQKEPDANVTQESPDTSKDEEDVKLDTPNLEWDFENEIRLVEQEFAKIDDFAADDTIEDEKPKDEEKPTEESEAKEKEEVEIKPSTPEPPPEEPQKEPEKDDDKPQETSTVVVTEEVKAKPIVPVKVKSKNKKQKKRRSVIETGLVVTKVSEASTSDEPVTPTTPESTEVNVFQEVAMETQSPPEPVEKPGTPEEEEKPATPAEEVTPPTSPEEEVKQPSTPEEPEEKQWTLEVPVETPSTVEIPDEKPSEETEEKPATPEVEKKTLIIDTPDLEPVAPVAPEIEENPLPEVETVEIQSPEEPEVIILPEDVEITTPAEEIEIKTPTDDGQVVTPGDDVEVVAPGDDVEVVTPGDEAEDVTPAGDIEVIAPTDGEIDLPKEELVVEPTQPEADEVQEISTEITPDEKPSQSEEITAPEPTEVTVEVKPEIKPVKVKSKPKEHKTVIETGLVAAAVEVTPTTVVTEKRSSVSSASSTEKEQDTSKEVVEVEVEKSAKKKKEKPKKEKKEKVKKEGKEKKEIKIGIHIRKGKDKDKKEKKKDKDKEAKVKDAKEEGEKEKETDEPEPEVQVVTTETVEVVTAEPAVEVIEKVEVEKPEKKKKHKEKAEKTPKKKDKKHDEGEKQKKKSKKAEKEEEKAKEKKSDDEEEKEQKEEKSEDEKEKTEIKSDDEAEKKEGTEKTEEEQKPIDEEEKKKKVKKHDKKKKEKEPKVEAKKEDDDTKKKKEDEKTPKKKKEHSLPWKLKHKVKKTSTSSDTPDELETTKSDVDTTKSEGERLLSTSTISSEGDQLPSDGDSSRPLSQVSEPEGGDRPHPESPTSPGSGDVSITVTTKAEEPDITPISPVSTTSDDSVLLPPANQDITTEELKKPEPEDKKTHKFRTFPRSSTPKKPKRKEHGRKRRSLDAEDVTSYIVEGSMPVHLPEPAAKHHKVVVAIDFGTTFSGYAYSFTTESDVIHIMRKWEGGDPGVTNMKTPTTLLLHPDGRFHSFGFSARDFYHDLDHNDAKKWLYFEKFKMTLHSSQDLNSKTELVAVNGKRLPAIEIFAYALKFFKEHALQELNDQLEEKIKNEDIRWVITVPAIWRQPAKQFMREAAYKAGISNKNHPEQILIALEPEAASIYIRKMRLHEIIPETEDNNRFSRYRSGCRLSTGPINVDFMHGTKYMVVDCGGGTVDITVHELEEHLGTLKELHKAAGGEYGSVSVDHAFEALLVEMFTTEFIEEFKVKRPAGWVDLMIAFEARKRNASPWKNNPLNVSLPFSFIDYYKKYTKTSTIEHAVKKFNNKDIKWSSQGMLRFTPEAMRSLFQPTLDHICGEIEVVLKKPSLDNINYLFLVGGFAESPLLQDEVRKAFGSNLRVIIPQDVGLTILKGAVLYGIDPNVVRVRRSPLTYGVGVLNKFIHGKHPEEKLIIKEEIEWVSDIFDEFVIADQPIAVGETVTRSYTPAKPNQKSTVINMYCSDKQRAAFITDEGVKKCGTLHIDMSDTTYMQMPRRREIQVSMQFGDTEIRVSALDIITGKEVKASIDFLRK